MEALLGHHIDSFREDYIKITVEGLITKEIMITAISELMHHSDYITKHSLWDLSGGSLGLSIGDLKEIVGILNLYKPETKSFANKSAIVVPGEMHKAVVNIFISMSKMLPFKYMVFERINDAKTFLSKA